MNTILVTGGAGFIGSTLCERLLELDYKVICLDNFNNYYSPLIKRGNISKAILNPHYTLVEGDIRDSHLLKDLFRKDNITTVIHLAALAGVRNSIDNPLEYVDVDIKGTVNLLEACRENNIQKFIFASSSSVYGSNPPPFSENQNVSCQVSPYAAAKEAGELFCKTYNSLYKLPIVVLRFFTVYGPRQRPEMAIHKFVNLINNNKEICVYGGSKTSRDYTFVDDIVDGITAAIALKCSYETFNLGNSSTVDINTLISIIEDKLGKTALKNYMRMQPGDVKCTWADISKAKKLLDYNPKVNIEKGIDRFVNWYIQKNKQG